MYIDGLDQLTYPALLNVLSDNESALRNFSSKRYSFQFNI